MTDIPCPENLTVQERKEFLERMEKPWFRSKKFIAFLIMEALLFSLLFMFIFTTKQTENTEITWQESAMAISMVFVMGFIALAFNEKQGTLDKFVRGIALVGSAIPSSSKDSKAS